MQTESIAVLDEEQRQILIHCAIHFGKNFSIMQQYYEKDGPGVNQEFSIHMIKELAQFEKENANFIDQSLHEEDLDLVKAHIKQYHQLQEVYELASDNLSKRICDLILTENHEPDDEINAVIACGNDAIDRLLAVVKLESFHSPLSPGYGNAPYHAAKALGKMQATEAVIPIFSLIQRAEFDEQETLITALKEIGEPAKLFLLERLTFTPFNQDNVSAAICLSVFEKESSIQNAAQNLMEQNPPELLAQYLNFIK